MFDYLHFTVHLVFRCRRCIPFLFNTFNQHKDSEIVTYWIEILVEKLILMKLYRFELLFFDGTVLTGNSALVCR